MCWVTDAILVVSSKICVQYPLQILSLDAVCSKVYILKYLNINFRHGDDNNFLRVFYQHHINAWYNQDPWYNFHSSKETTVVYITLKEPHQLSVLNRKIRYYSLSIIWYLS